MFIAGVTTSDNRVVSVQQSPSAPPNTVDKIYIAVTEAQYSQMSDLTHPAGGNLKWIWNGTIFTLNPDLRKILRVVASSNLIVVGTQATLTISVLKSDFTVDTAFNGQVIVIVQIGENTKFFRIAFVNGTKLINVPTTNINRIVELLPSPFSLVESSVPITIVQDL